MITKAKLEDLNILTDLFEEYRVFYRKTPDRKAAALFMAERLRTGDSEIFLVWSEAKPVGFVQLYPVFSSTRMRRLWLLNDLYVTPAARGKGYSLLLIDRAKELALATDACGLLLETEISNTIGNKLYPRAGFVRNEASHFYEWTA
jgi:GNAT superfamily N-acetyltransferase